MIEYKSKKDHYIGNWVVVMHTTPRPEDFKRVYFKINDVVYFEWSDEFAVAANQALMWKKLKDD